MSLGEAGRKRALLCHEYCLLIKDMQKFECSNMYGMDKWRSEAHEKLAEAFGLSVDETKEATGTYANDPDELFCALCRIVNGKAKGDKHAIR